MVVPQFSPYLTFPALEEDGFGSRRLYEGFIAESDELKEIVGCATYYFTYSTWYGKSLYMEDMFIKPEHRKNRIAVSFFHLVSQVSRKLNHHFCHRTPQPTNAPFRLIFQGGIEGKLHVL